MDNDAALLRAVTGATLPLAAKLMRVLQETGATASDANSAWAIVAGHMNYHMEAPAIACDEALLRDAKERSFVDALYRP